MFTGISSIPSGQEMLRNKSTATSTTCQCYHLTNFALTVAEKGVEGDTTVGSKEHWDTSVYYSASPTVTQPTECIEKKTSDDIESEDITTYLQL